MPLFSGVNCGASDVAAEVRTDGVSGIDSSSLGIRMGFVTGRFFLGILERRGPWLGGGVDTVDVGTRTGVGIDFGTGTDLAFDRRVDADDDEVTSAF